MVRVTNSPPVAASYAKAYPRLTLFVSHPGQDARLRNHHRGWWPDVRWQNISVPSAEGSLPQYLPSSRELGELGELESLRSGDVAPFLSSANQEVFSTVPDLLKSRGHLA